MNPANNYIEINRQSWNNRTETHLKSSFYNLEGFLQGKHLFCVLSTVCRA